MNQRGNHRAYRLRTANCADFAAAIVNFYYPAAISRNSRGDLGTMSPKQVARRMSSIDTLYPEAQLVRAIVPQVPGTARRSRPVRGVWESLLKQKRYLLAVLLLQPELIPVAAILNHAGGKFSFDPNVPDISPDWWTQPDLATADREASSDSTEKDGLVRPSRN
jgi:hypothetical protein